MDIIINKDVGYCGVLPDRRCVVKENGDCLMLSQSGWRLLSSSERDMRLNKMGLNVSDCSKAVKASKNKDKAEHRATGRIQGMLRCDTVKLDNSNRFIRTVSVRGEIR